MHRAIVCFESKFYRIWSRCIFINVLLKTWCSLTANIRHRSISILNETNNKQIIFVQHMGNGLEVCTVVLFLCWICLFFFLHQIGMKIDESHFYDIWYIWLLFVLYVWEKKEILCEMIHISRLIELRCPFKSICWTLQLPVKIAKMCSKWSLYTYYRYESGAQSISTSVCNVISFSVLLISINKTSLVKRLNRVFAQSFFYFSSHFVLVLHSFRHLNANFNWTF